ncbi:MAG: hypothetical protein HXY19_01830 [Thermoanaerobaculaceae bacterium]|nr:hypothetical protein [Thermoanaerobaculaceae bacterium]
MVALALCLMLAGELREGPGAAPTIVAIRVIRHDIFVLEDPSTSSWPYRLADALHVLSTEGFIRSMLLFREGEPLDPAKLVESERLLRQNGLLNPVTITAHPVEGGVEVVVETQDQWTTRPGLRYGKTGNRTSYGLALSESNFLGWGKHLELDIRHDPERRSWTAIYRDPLFLSTRWQVSLAHQDASDGKTEAVSVAYPFFSLATTLAGGVDWRHAKLVEHLYAGGKRVASGGVERRTYGIWGGLRVPLVEEAVDRLTVGVFGEEARYGEWAWEAGGVFEPPANRKLVGVEVGWQRETDRWVVVRGLRGWQRQEDVPLGPKWSASVGVSLPALGGDAGTARFAGHLAVGAFAESTFSWVDLGLSGRLEERRPSNLILHAEAGLKTTGRRGLLARIAADAGHRLDADRQLTLGADTGLRGWDPDTFDGTSRAVVNVEWRQQLGGEILHVGVLGLTLFGDAGRTWGARVGAGTGGWRADVGVGVMFESTRASILRLTRLEVGFPDDGSGPVYLLLSGSIF